MLKLKNKNIINKKIKKKNYIINKNANCNFLKYYKKKKNTSVHKIYPFFYHISTYY